LEGYDQDKSIFLVDGFTKGFQIPYVGEFSSEMSVCRPNRPKEITKNSDILTDYIEKELQAGRIAGPFHSALSTVHGGDFIEVSVTGPNGKPST